ncbi:MAG: Uncharacterised protein [Formosa sp. Hel1_33_131]|nr:MAG: Uncharacterised protein [Formosa sp. Hel1_33_131]
MTTTEVRKIIANAVEPKWFNSIEVTIEYGHIEFLQNFKGVSSIHKFLSQQISGWEKYESIPTVLNSSKQHFTNLKNRLDNFINAHQQQTENNLQSYWRTEQSQLQSNSNYFTYDSEYTDFLIDLNTRLPNSINGAYNFIIQTNTNLNDRNQFIGSLLAYEFDLKDKSDLTLRRKKESNSLSKLKNDFRAQLSESESQLTEHLTNANSDYKDYVSKIDQFKTGKEVLFNNWF